MATKYISIISATATCYQSIGGMIGEGATKSKGRFLFIEVSTIFTAGIRSTRRLAVRDTSLRCRGIEQLTRRR
jgi:hypothetical protein